LYKRTATGAVEEWSIVVIGSEQDATISVTHGLVGGRKQIATNRITEGKTTDGPTTPRPCNKP